MKTQQKYPVVLTIAGFDASGGAGIQADIKTISALGCFATSVLTALPVQNTQTVQSIFEIPSEIVKQQLEALLDDIIPDVIKIGMINTSKNVSAIAEVLKLYPNIPIILDPIMISSSGNLLIQKDAIDTIKTALFPLITMLTPNLDEAAYLAKMPIISAQDMLLAAEKIVDLGVKSVLIKGGHLNSDLIPSLYFAIDRTTHFISQKRINSKNTRGTGCTLSSAIASYLALGLPIFEALDLAHKYVSNAIDYGKSTSIGKGNGAMNHLFDPQKLTSSTK